MRALAVFVLFAGHLFAHDLIPVTLPVAPAGVEDKGDGGEPRVIITLTKHGEIYFRPSQAAFARPEAPKKSPALSLSELRFELVSARDRYHAIMKKRGKAGLKKKTLSTPISKLHVLLRVDKDAPWKHVQAIMITVAQSRFYKLHFGVKLVADRSYTAEEAKALSVERKDVAAPKKPQLEGRLKMFLPIDRSPIQQPGVFIGVHILGRTERPREWKNAGRVMMPTVIRYRVWTDPVVDDPAQVGKTIRKRRDEARKEKLKCRGTIKANNKVPFKHVAATLNQFYAAGVTGVDFYADWTPRGKQLRAKRLPYPRKAYGD